MASLVFKQGIALTGRNRTVPPCSVDRRTGHEPGPAAADRSRALQTTTDDADKRQRAKQYWPIRRASNNTSFPTDRQRNGNSAVPLRTSGVHYCTL